VVVPFGLIPLQTARHEFILAPRMGSNTLHLLAECEWTPPMRGETAHEWGTQFVGGPPVTQDGFVGGLPALELFLCVVNIF
jgi:hypothetical protein